MEETRMDEMTGFEEETAAVGEETGITNSVETENAQESVPEKTTNPAAKWYVVHTYSGYENKVMSSLEKTIENRNLQDLILEVRIPLQEAVEVKNGVSRTVQRKMFPGYVLVHMVQNEDTWYIVRNTRGVTGFVGPEGTPVALTETEMANLGIMSSNFEAAFKEGDLIMVVNGAWKDVQAKVVSADARKQTVTINVELFGRETAVEIGFGDVRKL